MSEPGAPSAENQRLRLELGRLLRLKFKLESAASQMNGILKTIDDPETFVDIAAFNLCESPFLKQKLLETLDVHDRLELFNKRLRKEIDTLRLKKKIQGDMPEDRVEEN